VAINLF